MRDYDIKRGHYANIEGDRLREIIREEFGKVTESDDGSYRSSFGAISDLKVKLEGKTRLSVDTTMDNTVDNELAAETVRRYNSFLQRATGFSAKERSKRLQKKAAE